MRTEMFKFKKKPKVCVQLASGWTEIKTVHTSLNGMYVKGFSGLFYLHKDGIFTSNSASVKYGGDPVSWCPHSGTVEV
jgi:hypothetical protein